MCTLVGIKDLFLVWQRVSLYTFQASVCQTTVLMLFMFLKLVSLLPKKTRTVIRDVNFVFFQKSILVLKKIDFFSIIEFVCCSLSTAAI